MMSKDVAYTLGIIGGSGLYELEELGNVESVATVTPFGAPSSAVVRGMLGSTRVLFLARHGVGHVLAPHEVNYRANVFALKALGATHVLSISAVGSLREEIAPGDLVTPTQILDRTVGRAATFFEGGLVAHVAMADPICPVMAEAVAGAATTTGSKVHRDKAYVCVQGPRFSTRIESLAHRAMGADVVGMTAAPEAFLAREAELPYATLALATDYDCWRPRDDVDVVAILATLRSNAARARETIHALAAALPDPSQSPAWDALRHAIISRRDAIDPGTRNRLAPLVNRYLEP